MAKVLVVATSRKTRGGITSVIKAHEHGEQWKRYHCHWVQTHRDGPAWRKIIYLACGLFDYLLRLPFYDIVHVHFSLKTTAKRKRLFVKFAKLLNKKVIIHLHCGSQIDEIWNEDYQYLFSHSDISLVLSENLKHKVERRSNIKSNFRVLYNPCPILNWDKRICKKNIILFSGTLYKEKGYRDLIQAFAMIARKYPNWTLHIAGNGEIETGKELAHSLGIGNQVKFLGWVKGRAKDKTFGEASIFCLPSYAEGFPMAVLDAWAYGLPVVTTPVGGIPDVAKDGENMLLFNPGDIHRLAHQLDILIADNALRDRIVKASQKLALNEFNQTTINRQLGEIYAECLRQTNTQSCYK